MIDFINTYIKLPSEFYEKVNPRIVSNPSLVIINDDLVDALNLNLSNLTRCELASYFSGEKLFDGSEPLAMAYAGHQFGHFVPQLSDGRAVLLGEVISKTGTQTDIQLKGSGQTKFSRRGDGLSSIGSVVREYIVSEAMYNLNIPTTRSLAIVATDDSVYRDKELPGGVLTRVASSHLRVGTFEYFVGRGDYDNLLILVNYAIKKIDKDLVNHPNKYFEFFKRICRRQIKLVTRWMGVGFIHGVMNTDNTSISGETIDYGPCAFMDNFSNNKVFSSIDKYGRYAYSNQGKIGIWNMSILGYCFIQLIKNSSVLDESIIEQINIEINNLERLFNDEYLIVMGKKFGIEDPHSDDLDLINHFLSYLQINELDFTNSFRKLCKWQLDDIGLKKSWQKRIHDMSKSENIMKSVNPVVIPRNHLIEKSIQLSELGDYTLLKDLMAVYHNPFAESLSKSIYAKAPEPNEVVHKTFCGT